MGSFPCRAGRLAALVCLALSPTTRAAPQMCRVIELDFIPAGLGTPIKTPPQMVAWLETPTGTFVDTVYITQQTGTFGLGNRPGQFDFNSGPMWPYGRRTTVFPVWAHRHRHDFRQVVFQDGIDGNLSHVVGQSSHEVHYCLPLRSDESKWADADAGTCASVVYTDKGRFSTQKSLYPPRADLSRDLAKDSSDVDTYGTVNPFDAISQATPPLDQPATASWSIPPSVMPGEYVLWVEVSREFDHNATYSVAAYPAPPISSFREWGQPYRGQPSIVYKVPFTLATTTTIATTSDYVGYGDPTGATGTLRPPDATITTNVRGSGAQRLDVSQSGYRIRVTAHAEPDFAPPSEPTHPEIVGVTSRSATVSFVAPGDDGLVGRAKRYEVRVAVGGQPITDATFADATLVDTGMVPDQPGTAQAFDLSGLLFETDYTVAFRAYDDCENAGPLVSLAFRTAERASGEVDYCFVATAAYGSALASDVELLRRFRDLALRQSVLGELAVEAYYTFGPALAGAIGESDVLRATARAVVAPFVDVARRFRL
jgi:hypothetical protein